MNTFIKYRCYKCFNSFSRLTDRDPERRVACFYGDCEGWMYPVEPSDNTMSQAAAIQIVAGAMIGFIILVAFALVSLLK